MVIDKWTRTQNNKNLSIPLLGHKSKETFIELKKEYERLQNLRHKSKIYCHSSLPNNIQNTNQIIDYTGIKELISEINSIIYNVNELILENNNNEIDNNNESPNDKDINSIIDKILLEYNNFVKDLNEIKTNKSFNYDYDVNSLLSESKNIINNIKKNYKKEEKTEYFENGDKKENKDKEEIKDKKENKDNNEMKETKEIKDNKANEDKNENKDNNQNNVLIEEQRNNNNNNNRNNINNFHIEIDRGHMNIFTNRREFNNSILVVKNNFQYSIEDERLNNGIKLGLYFFILLLILFVIYMCIF